MSADNTTHLAPNGCPLESRPEDPTHLFSSEGITLDLPRIGWIGTGCCTLIATFLSFFLIYRHYQYYTKPNQQRYIVRMLLMVPIYAITSWFSFVYVREAVYYDEIRVLYEAFVIASFLILMLQYLGDSLEEQKRVLKRHKKTERWFFPLCCLKYNPSRPHFLQFMKWGILQYVPLNVLGTILTITLQIMGNYCESSWNPKFGHVWIMMINFVSVSMATYFLIMFYVTIREDLKDYDPFYKFLAVKLVVFFSFWQSIVVEGLVYFGLIKATKYWSTSDISVGINAVLIDIEMVFFALMHLRAFSYKPY
ncbi:organic solute transporter subunit alpha/Transmembrane protein, partial [Gamsiella multidivaricata]|uniref:organic solute transporter subunit alpha/Transmembrane protein n=1 Tax=Gamsiella multidivaricata TaxID=101098 RepID=UPI00221FDACF